MAGDFVVSNSVASKGDNFREILKQIIDVTQTIEQLLAATGVEGAHGPEIAALTAAFSNLAAIAIQAAHAAAGKEITPESVMSLLPVNTPLGPSGTDAELQGIAAPAVEKR